MGKRVSNGGAKAAQIMQKPTVFDSFHFLQYFVFSLFFDEMLVEWSWPGHPFWAVLVIFLHFCRHFRQFVGGKGAVCLRIAVLMAKVSENGGPDVAKP